MTLIHQVTDLHVAPDGTGRACENFLALMAHVETCRPDLLLLTGDLPGEDGSREAYRWIHAALPHGIPRVVLPGNHDDGDAVFEIFESSLNRDRDFHEVIALEEIDLVFLNTATSRLPERQLQFIRQGEIRPGSVLFLHHPPRVVADGYMDREWPLLNRDDVDAALKKSPLKHVFCGHFHCEHEIHEDYSLYITPSPAFEVDLHSVEPRIGRPRIPLREIEIEGNRVSTRMVYLDDAGVTHA